MVLPLPAVHQRHAFDGSTESGEPQSVSGTYFLVLGVTAAAAEHTHLMTTRIPAATP